MRLLLDTHVILWAMYEPARLSARMLAVLSAQDAQLNFSSISVWEIGLKRAKWTDFHGDPDEVYERLIRSGANELPFSSAHALALGALPRHHGDPFDRALIAQALVEKLPLLTSDKAVRRYADRITLA